MSTLPALERSSNYEKPVLDSVPHYINRNPLKPGSSDLRFKRAYLELVNDCCFPSLSFVIGETTVIVLLVFGEQELSLVPIELFTS